MIGSIRRECVDHIVVWGEGHLRWILRAYARYYNDIRTHRSLDKDAPAFRPIQRIREHHVTSDPRWASSPLRSDLGFRYTQGWKAETLAHATAIFRQVNKNEQWLHHDALEFPGGRIVLLTKLLAGQEATVLQLPAQPTTAAEADAQMRLAYVG